MVTTDIPSGEVENGKENVLQQKVRKSKTFSQFLNNEHILNSTKCTFLV